MTLYMDQWNTSLHTAVYFEMIMNIIYASGVSYHENILIQYPQCSDDQEFHPLQIYFQTRPHLAYQKFLLYKMGNIKVSRHKFWRAIRKPSKCALTETDTQL